MTEVLELPFDLYQRYRLVSGLLGALEGLGETSGPPSVLDVGGRTAPLGAFLPPGRLTVSTSRPSAAGGVVGRASALPFADGSFDLVLAVDVLDRVAPAERAALAAECRRVARRWVVLANPWADPGVAETEELLEAFRRERDGREPVGRRHDLPDRAAVEAVLTAGGGRVASIPFGNLDRWLVAGCASAHLDEEPGLAGLARSFRRFYNQSVEPTDHGEPTYRRVLVAAVGDAALPAPADLGLSPAPAPSAAVAGLAELGLELAAFERERAAWETEREEWRRTASELLQRLDGGTPAPAEADDPDDGSDRAFDQAGRLGECSQALERMRFERGKLEEQITALGLELTERLEERYRLRGEMARELEEHRGVIAGLGEELGTLRGELEVQRREQDRVRGAVEAERAQLEVEVGRLGEESGELARRLRRSEEARVALRRTLAAREAELAALRRTLGDRLENLQRALGLRDRRRKSA